MRQLSVILLILFSSSQLECDAKQKTARKKDKRVEARYLAEAVGIETLGGVFTPLIARGTRLPASAVETFTTADDNQPAIEIHLLAGNAPRSEGNRTLAKLSVTNLHKAARRTAKVRVTFSVDVGGKVSLSAEDLTVPKRRLTLTWTVRNHMLVQVRRASSTRRHSPKNSNQQPANTPFAPTGFKVGLLKVLACPENLTPLRLATKEEVARTKAKVKNGQVAYWSGKKADADFEGLLIRRDGKIAYKITRGGVAVMLIPEALVLDRTVGKPNPARARKPKAAP